MIKVSGAGEGLSCDRGDLRGSGTVDGHEDDAARCVAVHAGVDDDILHIAGRGLKGGVAETGVGAVETAESAEACLGVGIHPVRRPEAGGEDALRAEDAEVVSLGDGPRDVIPAASYSVMATFMPGFSALILAADARGC